MIVVLIVNDFELKEVDNKVMQVKPLLLKNFISLVTIIDASI